MSRPTPTRPRTRLTALPAAAAALLLVGCMGEVQVEQCPPSTTRVGNQCAPTENLPTSGPRDAGPSRDAGPARDAGPTPDAGPGDAGVAADAGEQTQVSLPFWVDDHFAMSGFFPGPPASVEVNEDCTATGTDPASVCRRITLTPNGGTFGGFFFQSPADNWGQEPGLPIAPGAVRIRFRAWGAAPGVSAKFGAGIDNDEPNDDGWHVESAAIALPTEPTEYTVDLAQIRYDLVVGGFLWVLETPDGATPRTFFLDNLRWE